MAKIKDLTLNRYGRLIVLRFHGIINRNANWLCKCDCGNEKIIPSPSLVFGKVKSCGCYSKDHPSHKTHGMSKTATYKAFLQMHRRCNGYTAIHKLRYTDRGIVVCERWKVFENFVADMGVKPNGLSLDRIDNNGNYEPGNCRWATKEVQMKNRSNSVLITANNKTKCLSDWARETGIDRRTISTRLKLGWNGEDAVLTPIKRIGQMELAGAM